MLWNTNIWEQGGFEMSDETIMLIYIVASLAVVPVIIFALYAQLRVSLAFNKYKRVQSRNGKTGAQIAEDLLVANNVNAQVELGRGHLSDSYDSRTKTVALSNEVYHGNSVAALGIAAHEVGHAVQDEENYAPLKIRQTIIKSTSFINKLLLPLIFISFVVQIFLWYSEVYYEIFFWVLLAFAIIYFISFIINAITLPTEFNASKRAIAMLEQSGLSDDELRGAKNVLNAAALTYVAAFAISLVQFVRILMNLLIIARSFRR